MHGLRGWELAGGQLEDLAGTAAEEPRQGLGSEQGLGLPRQAGEAERAERAERGGRDADESEEKEVDRQRWGDGNLHSEDKTDGERRGAEEARPRELESERRASGSGSMREVRQ